LVTRTGIRTRKWSSGHAQFISIAFPQERFLVGLVKVKSSSTFFCKINWKSQDQSSQSNRSIFANAALSFLSSQSNHSDFFLF